VLNGRQIRKYPKLTLPEPVSSTRESVRQRMNSHRTIHILRAVWHPLDSRWKE